MFEFFKIIGRGFLLLIISPFALLYYAIYFLCSIFVFLFFFAKRIILFFRGEDMKAPLDIDLKAKKILETPIKEEEKVQPASAQPIINNMQPIFIQPAPGTIIASGYVLGPNGQPVMVNMAQPINPNQQIQGQNVQGIENQNTYPNQQVNPSMYQYQNAPVEQNEQIENKNRGEQ